MLAVGPTVRQGAVAFLLALGCEVDGSVGRDDPQGAGGGSGTAADGSGSGEASSASTGTSAGSAGGSGGTSRGESGPGSTDPDTGVDTMPTDVPAACHPVPDDMPCARCRKTMCCPALEACLGIDTCLCFWECTHSDQMVEECGLQCGTDGGLYFELATCVELHCEVCL